MKSINSKVILMISIIIMLVVVSLLFSVARRTKNILDSDSEEILDTAADYYEKSIDYNFRSAEQSVGTIYNYALAETEKYPEFTTDESQRESFTDDVAQLGKSIARSSSGALSLYMRFDPENFGPTEGFWYTYNAREEHWLETTPINFNRYDRDDLGHVGWYYLPVAYGKAMWMEPYYNANLGVNLISYVIPFYYEENIVGVIGMDVNLDLIRTAASAVKVYETGKAFIIDTNGNIIYSDSYPKGVASFSLLDEDKEYLENLLEHKLGESFLIVSTDGVECKVVLKELINGMILGVYAPLEEIEAPQSRLINQLIKIFIIVLLLAALSSVLQHISSSMLNKAKAASIANEAKGEFLANMSHEVRTPINAILGMNEMIIRESKESEIVEYAANIKQAGRSLLAQVNGILDYSKLEDGKMDIFPVEYDIATVINASVTSINSRAKAKGLDFELQVDPNLPVKLLGDDVRLEQVIMNLLTNAIKYTEEGSVHLTVSDGGRKDDNILLAVSVEDTGIGIKEEDIDKLGISFKRVDEEKNRNIEGTGLGIPIVMKILSLMGSELQVESVYGKGSKFSFLLPQGIVDAEPLGDYRSRVKKSNRKRNTYTYPSMPQASVLLVDDYEMNLMVARNLMKIYDFVPDLVSSGREAITMIEEKAYDVIFMDHMMPGMDGVETLEQIKKSNLIDDSTAVVALTANAIAGAKEYYISKGFNDYLTKPIDAEALEDMLLKYVPQDKIVKKSIADIKNSKNIIDSDEERKALVKIFISSIEDTAKSLDELYYAEDIKNYTIKVHGLKSTARLIGEMSVSNKAEQLEKAGKAGDWDYIKANHESLMEEYRSIGDGVKEIKPSKKTLEEGDLKDALLSIIEMANVCDYTSTEMVLDSLAEYELAEDVEKEMKRLRGLLEKLDYKAVAEEAKKLL